MASIYKRDKKLWIRYSVNGKEYRESLGLSATNQGWAEARRIKRIKEGELAQGIYYEKLNLKNKSKLQAAFDEYLETKTDLSQATEDNYNAAFNKLKDFTGDIKLIQIDDNLVKKFEKWLRHIPNAKGKIIKERSITSYINNLRIIFTYFVEKGYMSVNPFPKKRIKDAAIKTIPMDELEEILPLLRETNIEHYKIIMMFLLTGMRASELTRLTNEDIDFKNNKLYIRNHKGHRVDQFPLYPKLLNFLIENFELKEGKVFDRKDRHSFKFWKRFLAGENAEKKVFNHYSIHTLRRTFITMLANGGMNIFDVSKLARHRDIRTTLKSYAAAEIDRMGEAVNAIENISTIYSTNRPNHLKLVK
jgi:integrase